MTRLIAAIPVVLAFSLFETSAPDARPSAGSDSVTIELSTPGGWIKIPDSKPIRLACHPSKGPLFVCTDFYAVLAINSETGRVTPTPAEGNFLAVDPANGEYLYTGTRCGP
jgi:hypothetical protein